MHVSGGLRKPIRRSTHLLLSWPSKPVNSRALAKGRSKLASGAARYMAFQSVLKISTIRLELKRPQLSSILEIACRPQMPSA